MAARTVLAIAGVHVPAGVLAQSADQADHMAREAEFIVRRTHPQLAFAVPIKPGARKYADNRRGAPETAAPGVSIDAGTGRSMPTGLERLQYGVESMETS